MGGLLKTNGTGMLTAKGKRREMTIALNMAFGYCQEAKSAEAPVLL
jgi:hypothetical protein